MKMDYLHHIIFSLFFMVLVFFTAHAFSVPSMSVFFVAGHKCCKPCWEAQCLDFVDKAFSNGPGCDCVWWLRPERVPGARWGWQVSPCWPPAEQGTVPASRDMEGAGWQCWSHSSCSRPLSCSRTCWGISSLLRIGEASQQVKNLYVFSWALPGMMCQVKSPAHWWAFCQGQAAQV